MNGSCSGFGITPRLSAVPARPPPPLLAAVGPRGLSMSGVPALPRFVHRSHHVRPAIICRWCRAAGPSMCPAFRVAAIRSLFPPVQPALAADAVASLWLAVVHSPAASAIPPRPPPLFAGGAGAG
jgi:hypothetical protein